MVVYSAGPTNIEQGNSAKFVIEFLSTSGAITTPTSASLSITYVDTSNVSVTESVTLTQEDSFFTGTWSSTSAALGLASWTTTAAGSTTAQAAGQLRILQRQSTY
jgi:hypothetical protein